MHRPVQSHGHSMQRLSARPHLDRSWQRPPQQGCTYYTYETVGMADTRGIEDTYSTYVRRMAVLGRICVLRRIPVRSSPSKTQKSSAASDDMRAIPFHHMHARLDRPSPTNKTNRYYQLDMASTLTPHARDHSCYPHKRLQGEAESRRSSHLRLIMERHASKGGAES
jgi:hypothetical protein